MVFSNSSSGQHILSQIDSTLVTKRRDIATMQEQIKISNKSLDTLLQSSIKAYKTIAKVRLELIDDKKFLGTLEQADKRAKILLDEREKQIAQLNKSYNKHDSIISKLENAREIKQSEVNKLESDIENLTNKTLEQLRKLDLYNQQIAIFEKAEVTYSNAQEKTEIAVADLEAKSVAYKDDKLFMYLWTRGYNTNKYKANNVIRMLDNWVATLIGYNKARTSYQMVVEIPKKLNEHAEYLQKQAEKEQKILSDLENKALEKNGINKLEASLAKLQEQLELIDKNILKAEQQLEKSNAKQKQFNLKQDTNYLKAEEIIAQMLQRKPINQVENDALRTKTKADDSAVYELIDFNQSKQELSEEITLLENTLNKHYDDLSKLDSIRQRYKSYGYDAYNSYFNNSGVVMALLSQVLQGSLNSNIFWNKLSNMHHRKTLGHGYGNRRIRTNWGGLGGNSWGRSSRGSSWGGGISFPSGGGRSGGGFKTGGGF